ncbi:hypothetical protein GCM10027168_74760 [Streptomyces capparidis]
MNRSPLTPHRKQVPMNSTTRTPAPHRTASPRNRSRDMQLMPEALARAHMQERLAEAESQRRVIRLLRARALQRRAERASLRARRALAVALMQ